MSEQVIDMVRAYPTGRDGNSLVASITKEARELLDLQPHQRLHEIVDVKKKRLIYEVVAQKSVEP